MVLTKIPYLHEIDGQLHYRRRVPGDLKNAFGKTEWKHALGLSLGQEAHAAKLVADYNLAYANLIAQARIQTMCGTTPVFQNFGAAPVPQQPLEQRQSKREAVKFSEAYAYDREAHGGQRNERAVMQSVDSFLNQYGDADILTLTPKDVQQWINACLDKGQKASTIQRRINALRAIVGRYYRDHEIDKTNPFSKPNVKDGNSTSSDRLPFHKDHLKKMDHYFAKAPRLSDDIRRLYLILKLTGARPLEIGGLDADDVLLDHEVPHIWIRNNSHRRVKTKGSERRIPLVGDALEAATAQKLANPKGSLFPTPFHDTNSLSQRLNKLIRRAGVPKSPRLVVYSFRHTMEEAMRSAGVREHTQKRIMGHTDQSITGRYGAPHGQLEELQTAIKEGTAVLGKVDATVFSETELPSSLPE